MSLPSVKQSGTAGTQDPSECPELIKRTKLFHFLVIFQSIIRVLVQVHWLTLWRWLRKGDISGAIRSVRLARQWDGGLEQWRLLAVIRHQESNRDWPWSGTFCATDTPKWPPTKTNVKSEDEDFIDWIIRVGRTLVHCVCVRVFLRISVLSVKLVRPNDATEGGG